MGQAVEGGGESGARKTVLSVEN